MMHKNRDIDTMDISDPKDNLQGSYDNTQARVSPKHLPHKMTISQMMAPSSAESRVSVLTQHAAHSPGGGYPFGTSFAGNYNPEPVNESDDAITEDDESDHKGRSMWKIWKKDLKASTSMKSEDICIRYKEVKESNRRKKKRIKEQDDRMKEGKNREMIASDQIKGLKSQLRRARHHFEDDMKTQQMRYIAQLERQQNDHVKALSSLDSQLRAQAQALVDTEKSYERKVEMQTNQIRQLRNDQEKRIRSAQDAATFMMKDVKSRTLSDDEIESFFRSQASKWQKWASRNAHKDAFILSQDKTVLLQTLGFIPSETGHQIPQELLQGQKAKKTPSLLLQALLANFICNQITAKPFWIVDAVDFWLAENPNDQLHIGMPAFIKGEQIESLFALLRRVQLNEAQAWRAQTAQTLYDIIDETLTDLPKTGLLSLLHAATNLHEERLVEQFLDGPAKELLVHTEQSDRDQREFLKEDIRKCQIFSTRLWSQRSLPRICGHGHFETLRFHHTNALMVLHESQNPNDLHIGDDEESNETLYDDLPIGLLVQPAVVAYGNEQGENYTLRTRIWSPAIVWVSGTRQRHQEKLDEIKKEKARKEQEEREKWERQQEHEAAMEFHRHDYPSVF